MFSSDELLKTDKGDGQNSLIVLRQHNRLKEEGCTTDFIQPNGIILLLVLRRKTSLDFSKLYQTLPRLLILICELLKKKGFWRFLILVKISLPEFGSL